MAIFKLKIAAVMFMGVKITQENQELHQDKLAAMYNRKSPYVTCLEGEAAVDKAAVIPDGNYKGAFGTIEVKNGVVAFSPKKEKALPPKEQAEEQDAPPAKPEVTSSGAE